MLIIRSERPEDHPAVYEINRRAFETDALFVLELSPRALDGATGPIAYHPLFDGVP